MKNRLYPWGFLSLLVLSSCGKNSPSSSVATNPVDSKPTPAPPLLIASPTPSPISPEPDPATTPIPSPTATPVVSTPPPDRPQVLVGWLDKYSDFIESKIVERHSELLNLDPVRMKAVCPRWIQLNPVQRRTFWSTLLWAIANPESSYQRTQVFSEPTSTVDRVTGLRIRSEGLMQISYSDVRNYRYLEGDISWYKDKEMALNDYAMELPHGNPKRTILNAYANLNLAIWIMAKNLRLHDDEAFDVALAHYWSTMDVKRKGFPKVLKGLQSKAKYCF